MAKTVTTVAVATTPKNPMKTAIVTAKFEGIKDETIKAYFEGKKVAASKNGANWVFSYTARGAAKNDIKKRLDTVTRNEGKFEIVDFTVENLEKKATAKS